MLLTPKNLRTYQWRTKEFVTDNTVGALFVDMGLGKTISVLTAIKSILLHGLTTTLVVGPLRVVQGVWQQEGQKWTHTRDIKFSLVHGPERLRLARLATPAHVYLINVEGLAWLLDLLKRLGLDKPDLWPFDMLVLDESSLFKSHSTKRFEALQKVLHLFKRRYILTGTPTPNSLMDLWPQLYLLDMGERLGNNFWRFKNRFFAPEHPGEHARYTARPGADRYINKLIGDLVLRLDASDYFDLPPVIHNDVMVDLPPKARDLYDEMEEEMFLEMDNADVEAMNAAVLSGKCHQIANGAVYGDDRDTGSKVWELVHDEKLNAMEEIIDECGSNLLIAYQFKHDLERLKKRFKYGADVSKMKITDFEREWNAGNFPYAFMHPKSAAHGLNLQHGGNAAAFFSLTWSREQMDQYIERVGATRQAQAGRTAPVKVYRVRARSTVDDVIAASNQAKDQTQRGFLRALRDYRKQRQHG